MKVTVPVAVSKRVEPVGFGGGLLDSSVIAPACVSLVMTGVSLVPVTMIVTGLVVLTPWLSVTVTS